MSYTYPDLSDVKRILIIKMRHLGDVLLTAPLFSCLKKALPEAEIEAFIYKESAPMLEGHPAISDLILYDRNWKKLSFVKKLFKELELLLTIRSRRYDLVINLTEGDRGAIVAWASGAKHCVGFDPQGSGFLGKKSVYTHLIKHCPNPRHTVEKNLDALRRIGIFPKAHERDLFLHIPEGALSKVRDLLSETKDFVVIHPASRWRFKCLPTETMAQVVKALKKQNIEVVLTSGPDSQEMLMVDEIVQKSGESVINLAGKLNLKELAALIQLSSGLICVDSVALHIASALKTPVVVAFGPTSEINWGPWMHAESKVVMKNVSCRPCFMDGCGGSKRSDCLYTLSADQILDAFEELQVIHNK